MTKIGVWEQVLLVLPMLVLLILNTPSHARPRRRFCENYPFARRCLGVAAKRSLSKTDIYTALIQKAIEDTRETLDNHSSDAPRDSSSASALSKIISALINHDSSEIYPDTKQGWEETFEDYDSPRRA